jgi:hypothetical protein
MARGHSKTTPPEVGLCTGKDCRRADGFRTVQRELASACTVIELPCLDVCDGALVVLSPRDEPVVVERVRNRAMALEIIAHVVDDAPLPGRLRKRRLSGSKRSKALRRLDRAL